MEERDVILTVASQNDVQDIYDLMRKVYERLEDKTLFVLDSLEYVNAQITKEGFAVIARNKDESMVGAFIFRYPHMEEDNLGRDIQLADEQLNRVVHMESAVVLPEYRGGGLQSKMLQYAEKLIDKNRYKYFMATVSPDNPASYKSLEKNGYKCMTTKEKYHGKIRRIYLKEV